MLLMLLRFVGKVLRWLSTVKGKGFLANRIISPLLRGKGLEIVVDLHSLRGGESDPVVRLICGLDDWIPWNVFLYGYYRMEENYQIFMLAKAKSCRVIFDIGANIGYYTVQFSRITNGRVWAFEPCRPQFDTLQRNIALNNLENVVTSKTIVSDSDKKRRIYFYAMHNTGRSSLEISSEQFEDVQATSIDHYCAAQSIAAIDLMKIDVEGHELRVLHGMCGMLAEKKVGSLFIELNEHTLQSAGNSIEDVVTFLSTFGYSGHSIKSGVAEKYLGENESLVFFTRAGVDPNTDAARWG